MFYFSPWVNRAGRRTQLLWDPAGFENNGGLVRVAKGYEQPGRRLALVLPADCLVNNVKMKQLLWSFRMTERIIEGHIGPVVHPLRQTLLDELHARPFEPVVLPACIVSFSLLTREIPKAAQIAHLNELCVQYGLPVVPANSNQFHAQCDGFTLTWSRHTEFSSYTFFLPGAKDFPFASAPYDQLPQSWCSQIQGELISAVRLVGLGKAAPMPERSMLDAVFGQRAIVGGLAVGGKAGVWTSFYPDETGFVRILVKDIDLSERQAGRLVRRLIEIQSYCLMALLALPVAQQIAPDIGAYEVELGEVVDTQTQTEDVGQERSLLTHITDLAARVEHLVASTTYRFGAAHAYNELVSRRINEIREVRVEGIQPLREFMERRLEPAMRTCETMRARLNGLALRVARASELLRTSVDVTLAAQNRNLLASMNRRAQMQLRLQQTVEGLSIVAITYYASSVIGHFASGLEGVGVHLSGEVIGGLSVPVVALLAWLGLRKVHHQLARKEGETEEGHGH